MKKIKLTYKNETFLLNEKVLSNKDRFGNDITPTITISRVEGASLIKQFVKKSFPKIGVSSSSETFSMGNAIDVYLFNKTDGSSISEDIVKTVKEFADSLKMGYFNSWEEMYEYSNKDRKTDDGIKFESYCKWITVNNNAKFGTIEWGINELNNGRTKEETAWYMNNNTRDKFLNL